MSCISLESSLRSSLWLGLAAAAILGMATAPARGGDGDAKSIEFFEKKIRPLLADHCYECHGPDEQKSGLRLDTWEGMEAGGETGEALFSDEPETSLLMAVLNYELDDLQMPPDGKLDDDQIADVLQWLESGAPHPDREASQPKPDTEPAKGKAKTKPHENHWSFQPLEKITPPSPLSDWERGPLDAFLSRALAAKGIEPAGEADRATLIRRATLDLWGLPPTPGEAARFAADMSPDAYERLIDRLLASPRYGERWGRHWLDVARYADSNGLDENIAHGNAWRYRDYVVAAWNHDKPFDRFVVEQIAGDRLPASSIERRHEQLIATGFLSLGPKVLAEGDLQKLEMDIIDEQIDTLGRAFMGMTLGCARCHDHKFDPISTEDYYALAGVFKSTQTMESLKRIARWYEHSLVDAETSAAVAANELAVARAQEAVNDAIAKANAALTAKEQKLAAKEREAKWPKDEAAQVKKLRDALAAAKANQVEYPTAMGVTEGQPADIRVHIRGSHLSLGKVAQRRFPTAIAGEEQGSWPEDRSGRLRLAEWLVSDDHPLTSRVIVNRVWRWHFGRGLCASTDNFGKLGEPPTHPKLLDWLATKLIADGWSIKRLHRRIMLSAAYRMSSEDSPAAREADPENQYYWRFEPRRLEAEAIRDAMLYVSGRLDESMGGSLLHVKNREFFFNHLSKDTTSYDSQRRSLYLPVVRNNLYDVFTLFDYSDASVLNGNRASTTVAPQALFMMNSDLVLDCSASLARHLVEAAPDNESRVEMMFKKLLGRSPSSSERERVLRFVGGVVESFGDMPDGQDELEAWKLAAQIGLASNEFIYLR